MYLYLACGSVIPKNAYHMPTHSVSQSHISYAIEWPACRVPGFYTILSFAVVSVIWINKKALKKMQISHNPWLLFMTFDYGFCVRRRIIFLPRRHPSMLASIEYGFLVGSWCFQGNPPPPVVMVGHRFF